LIYWLLLFVFGAENASSARARVFSLLCVWVFRGRRESGWLRVRFSSSEALKRVFFFFYPSDVKGKREEVILERQRDERARRRVRARVRVRKRETARRINQTSRR
jgi:hypothetical protein